VNNGKQSFTATAPVTVGSTASADFQPDFSYFADVQKPDLIAFTPSVLPANTPVTKVTWDFGDGTQLTKSVLSQVTNIYSKAGTYTVTLTVFSTNNVSAARAKQVIVVLPSRSRGVRH